MTFSGSPLKIISITILLLSCSARDSVHIRVASEIQEEKYYLRAQKSDSQNRFNLHLQNTSDEYLCVRAAGWPSEGIIDDCNAGSSLSLSYAGKTVSLKESWCYEGQSRILIPPRSSLDGYLNYADFSEDPQQIHDEITINLSTVTRIWICDTEEIEYYHRTRR